MNYDELLFTELRLVSVESPDRELDNDLLIKAMTVNEELLALGYTLSPKDVIMLSKSASLEGVAGRVREYAGDVKAEPMYPGFPQQVMEMDAATFRFHQLLHYLSTYGLEDFTGAKVRRGWLPDIRSAERSVPDDRLLAAKVLGLVTEDGKYLIPYKKILSKTERMTDKEKMIIRECCRRLTADRLASVRVTFKQNLLDIFDTILNDSELSSDEKLTLLRTVCQHTGDVWKCMDYSLTRAGYHFRTSQKRLIVKLLESFPVNDFKSNLVLSLKKGERVELMLRYLDFNEYSRKADRAEAVALLRSGKLRSWESRAKYLAEQGLLGALDHYSERPGMMLRSMTYLLRKGYSPENISAKLMPRAQDLKTQTLVSLAAHFSQPENCWADTEKYREALKLQPIVKTLLQGRLCYAETPIKNQKVYVDESGFDLSRSVISVTDKSDEGGYIRSGMAFRIPEAANRIRFFVYWNDADRVDVDLHATGTSRAGTRAFFGWNTNFKSETVVTSGDITHSDAAEYIDIDLTKARCLLDHVTFNINLFAGKPSFGQIDECFVGIMAVGRCGEDIKLYDPKNCFFTHRLTSSCRTMNYGFVDLEGGVIVFDGAPIDKRGEWYSEKDHSLCFTVNDYLDLLLRAQNAERVTEREQADAVLVVGKPSADEEISLIDSNFFMDN